MTNKKQTITLIPGDGIGPEITDAVVKILDKAGANLDYDVQTAGADVATLEGSPLPDMVLHSIKKYKIALKAPITTPIGIGFKSVNVQLRKALNLYASLRPAKNIDGIKTRFDNVDLVVVRENTEDLYAGVEKKIDNNTAHSLKIITRQASLNIAKFAFEYALKNNRKEVCAVSKANICKLSDGLFLECTREISNRYPQISYKEILVDNLCMQLVSSPDKFDVLVLPNLYGDIVSDLTSGLIGGLGVAQGANIGDNCAVFEPVHGSAPDIKGKNLANPTALLLSACMMLDFINKNQASALIKSALVKTFNDGVSITKDLGGNASLSAFTDEIIYNLNC